MAYDLKPIKAPRLSGDRLRVVTFLLENSLTGSILSDKLLKDLGIFDLRKTSVHPKNTPLPSKHLLFENAAQSNEREEDPPLDLSSIASVSEQKESFQFETVGDFIFAYQEGHITPEEVAVRILEITRAHENHHPPMRTFIAQHADDLLQQANESKERYLQGNPIGPLDGVPVAIKDEVDQVPYPTTAGTSFLGRSFAQQDAETVARLRAAGAMLIGKTNMHEIGLGVTGFNIHYGTARNPYDPERFPGGSSSGSAAAVASGLCPLSLGADAGGSIRIPSSLCGTVGLKATFGRISESGATPLCWSIAHIGPIGASVRDVALGYALMAGPDPKDTNTHEQPKLRLSDFSTSDLQGVKLGVFRPWIEDAEPDVVSTTKHTLERFKEAGAEIIDVDIPELGLLRAVHLVTVAGEMLSAQEVHYKKHQKDYSLEVRSNLALTRRLLASDYVNAQRHRVRIYEHFAKVLAKVDAIITPTTSCTAPILAEDALPFGESDLSLFDKIVRYAFPANLTGLPAISFPAGYDAKGLPIGVQAIGRAWEEHVLLRLAFVAEGFVTKKRPKIYQALLKKSS